VGEAMNETETIMLARIKAVKAFISHRYKYEFIWRLKRFYQGFLTKRLFFSQDFLTNSIASRETEPTRLKTWRKTQVASRFGLCLASS